MTIGEGEQNRYIVIDPGTKSSESKNPGALFVALSRAKTAGDESSKSDFYWHPDVLVNEDRLCFSPNTPRTKAYDREVLRIQDLSKTTRHNYKHLDNEDMFYEIMSKIYNVGCTEE